MNKLSENAVIFIICCLLIAIQLAAPPSRSSKSRSTPELQCPAAMQSNCAQMFDEARFLVGVFVDDQLKDLWSAPSEDKVKKIVREAYRQYPRARTHVVVTNSVGLRLKSYYLTDTADDEE